MNSFFLHRRTFQLILFIQWNPIKPRLRVNLFALLWFFDIISLKLSIFSLSALVYSSSCPVSDTFGLIDTCSEIEKNWKSINAKISPPYDSTIIGLLSSSLPHSNTDFPSKIGSSTLHPSVLSISSKPASSVIAIPVSCARTTRHESEDDLQFSMSFNDDNVIKDMLPATIKGLRGQRTEELEDEMWWC